MGRKLEEITFNLSGGLMTKFRQEDVLGVAFETFQNMDCFEEWRGAGKVPGSTRISNTAPSSKAWESIHYFDYNGLDGSSLKETIGIADRSAIRIESDQSLTTLGTGLEAEEPMHGITFNDRLHLASKNNTPIKVDGSKKTLWGVRAPGQTRTTKLALISDASWTVNGSNTKGTSTNAIEGATSVQVNKVDTSTTELSITRTGLSLDLSSAGDDQAFVWLFTPGGALGKLVATGAAVRISLGDTGLSNASHYDFEIGNLAEGWKILTLNLASPDSTSGTGATLGNIVEAKLILNFGAAISTQSGFLWNFLHETDSATCTATLTSGTSITGTSTVSYAVTFVSEYGFESNRGSASSTVSIPASGGHVNLTEIPTSADSQVIARRIYRDKDGDGQYRLIKEIFDNATTTFLDNIAHGSRSLVTAPQAATNKDHTHPDKMNKVVFWNGYAWGIDADTPFRLKISDTNNVEAWPTGNIRDFDTEITNLVPTVDALLVFLTDKIIRVTGGLNGAQSFNYFQINPEIGSVGLRATEKVKNAIITWHDDGPYIVTTGIDPWYIGAQIKDQIDQLEETEIKNLFMVHDRARFRVLFFAKSTAGGNYDKIFYYQYGGTGIGNVSPEGTGVDPLDVRGGRWGTIKLPTSVLPVSATVVERTSDKPLVVIGTSDGVAYTLQDPTKDDYATGSTTEAVDSILESTYAPLGSTWDDRGWPRYLVLNADSDGASTWTITVTTSEDVDARQEKSASKTILFPNGKSSRKVSLPRGLKGSFVKVKLQNNREGEHTVFRNMRLQYIAQPSRGRR